MLIFLHGLDTYRLKEKYTVILNRYKEKNPHGLSFLRLEGNRTKFDVVREFLATSGMFEEKKLLVLENFLSEVSKEAQESIWDLLMNEGIERSEQTIVLFLQDAPPDKRTRLFKQLIQKSRTQEFKPLPPNTLSAWAHQYAEQRDASLEARATSILLQRTSTDLWKLTSEIQKLAAYAGKNPITPEIVARLVHETPEADAFELLDAFSRKNSQKALKLLHGLFEQGEVAQRLIGLIFFQLRTLITIYTMQKDGIAERDFAKRSKIHPFVIRKSLPLLKTILFDELKEMYLDLFELEQGIYDGTNKHPEMMLEVYIMKHVT